MMKFHSPNMPTSQHPPVRHITARHIHCTLQDCWCFWLLQVCAIHCESINPTNIPDDQLRLNFHTVISWKNDVIVEERV